MFPLPVDLRLQCWFILLFYAGFIQNVILSTLYYFCIKWNQSFKITIYALQKKFQVKFFLLKIDNTGLSLIWNVKLDHILYFLYISSY